MSDKKVIFVVSEVMSDQDPVFIRGSNPIEIFFGGLIRFFLEGRIWIRVKPTRIQKLCIKRTST